MTELKNPKEPGCRNVSSFHSEIVIRKPDPFDGSDFGKLDTFILQYTLTFRANKRAYATDEDKVTFAILYLKGTALKHFSPGLTQTRNPLE